MPIKKITLADIQSYAIKLGCPVPNMTVQNLPQLVDSDRTIL